MTSSSTKAGRKPAGYHLDAPLRRHQDPEKFIIYVLWLIGLSASSIGQVVTLTRAMVLGVANRSDYRNRSAMTDQQRRDLLQELKEVRFEDGVPLDGGALHGIDWTVRPLDGRKLKQSGKARKS